MADEEAKRMSVEKGVKKENQKKMERMMSRKAYHSNQWEVKVEMIQKKKV